MSQTIVQQVLDYYTDKTTSMAVKISRQADEIKHLNQEITRLMTLKRDLEMNNQGLLRDLDSSRQAEVGLAADVLEARQQRDTWHNEYLDVLRDQEPFEQLAEAVMALNPHRTTYDELQSCREMANKLIKVEPLEPAAKAS